MTVIDRTAVGIFLLAVSVCGAATAGSTQIAATADAISVVATTLTLSADGEAKLPPDMATITLGVESTEGKAANAIAATASRMNRVVAALKAAGVSGRDLQTSDISLSPQYVYEQGQAPRLTGYQVSNQLTVTVNDLPRLGETMDAAVSAGATNLGQVSFGLSNRHAAENSARLAAVRR